MCPVVNLNFFIQSFHRERCNVVFSVFRICIFCLLFSYSISACIFPRNFTSFLFTSCKFLFCLPVFHFLYLGSLHHVFVYGHYWNWWSGILLWILFQFRLLLLLLLDICFCRWFYLFFRFCVCLSLIRRILLQLHLIRLRLHCITVHLQAFSERFAKTRTRNLGNRDAWTEFIPFDVDCLSVFWSWNLTFRIFVSWQVNEAN